MTEAERLRELNRVRCKRWREKHREHYNAQQREYYRTTRKIRRILGKP